MSAARAGRLALAGLVVLGGGGRVARADNPDQTPATIDVDRDDSPAGRVELGFDSGAPLAAWGASAQLGYLLRPIAIDRGGVVTYPVDQRATITLGGALAIGDSVVVDARLPLSWQSGDRFVALGDSRALAAVGLGDLRLTTRIRVAGDDANLVAARVALTLPTGRDNELLGEARYTVGWGLIGRITLAGGIVLAATAGIRLRGAEVVVADRVLGDEVNGAAGIVVPLPPLLHLWCKREQFAATAELDAVLGDDVDGVHGPSPVEARVGFVGHPRPHVTIGVRAGVGLDDQIGAPRFRALLAIAYTPDAPPAPPPGSVPASDEE